MALMGSSALLPFCHVKVEGKAKIRSRFVRERRGLTWNARGNVIRICYFCNVKLSKAFQVVCGSETAKCGMGQTIPAGPAIKREEDNEIREQGP